MSQLHSSYQQKAESYAQFRWDYAPAAIDHLCQQTGLRCGDHVVDVGSGTGMLSRRFVMRGMQVYGVEPEAEMRATAENLLQPYPNFYSVAATAEATTLPDASVDLITVGRALHWFTPEAARREFCRILKPGGCLAVLAVENLDTDLRSATRTLKAKSNGFRLDISKESQPKVELRFYFGHADFLELAFADVKEETWP
jgi:ubiquinone/menaquinone biosynthesis C-methylase UbiE